MNDCPTAQGCRSLPMMLQSCTGHSYFVGSGSGRSWERAPVGVVATSLLEDSSPKAPRTHILRFLAPKTILYRAFGLF